MISDLIIVLFAVIIWIALIYYFAPAIRKSRNFSPYGPALMVKITTNRGLLDRASRRFPGKGFSRVSVVIVIVSAIIAIAMLSYGIILGILELKSGISSAALPVTELIGLPGINPVIPIGYGAAALIFSVVIHEVFHGIVARKHGIKVKSVGALFFIIPIGAFVEPDEDEMVKADPVVRRRIVAAGPGINIVIGVVAILAIIFLMGPSVHPIHNGAYLEESGSKHITVPTGSEIIKFGNYSGSKINTLATNSTLMPGKLYNVTYFDHGKENNTTLAAGIMIISTIQGYPAYNNLTPGGIILTVDNTTINNDTQLNSILDSVSPGSPVNISEEIFPANSATGFVVKNATIGTVSKYSYYAKYDPSANKASYKNESFIGVTVDFAGLGTIPISDLAPIITGGIIVKNPVSNFLGYLGLPFEGLSPVPSGVAALFSVPFSPLVFWGVLNTLYWLFWLNFLLGITNALPFVVLDGGQFFRDTLFIGERRKSLSFLKSDKVKMGISTFLNMLVFLLLFGSVILAVHGV